MRRECTSEENAILKECGADILTYPGMYKSSRYLPGNQFWVNGGTVLNYLNYNKEDAFLTIAEDDLKDEMGNRCCIKFPVPGDLDIEQGERILLVYTDTDAYIPLRVTERTQSMISMQNPDYFDEVDWDKTVKIPHPAILELDKKPRPLNEQDVETFKQKCNNTKDIKAKNWVGVILSSLLFFMLFALLFVFMVGSFITSPVMAIVAAVVTLAAWGGSTVLFAKVVFSGKTRGLNKMHYKQKVMYLDIREAYSMRINGVKIKNREICVYEYENGELKYSVYLVNNNVFLPKDIPYGKVIYRYSKREKISEYGLNYFASVE